jgi:hypothetical protein
MKIVRSLTVVALLLLSFAGHCQEAYQLHNSGMIWRYTGTPCAANSCPGWQMLDNNLKTRAIVAGDQLYQLHNDGMIWRYTGTPCAGNSCPGWQLLDNNPKARAIAIAGDQLYQLHNDGMIWRYTGTPCAGKSCPGWQRLDNNPKTRAIAAAGNQLYQLHNDGMIWRYTGKPCKGNSCPGWQRLDNNRKTRAIAAAGDRLYQLHNDGMIWRYTGTPCAGNSCPGWQMLDNNPKARAIVAAGDQLYQLHNTGMIWRYTGTPCAGTSCPGWQMLDNNPKAQAIAAAGDQLYQLHNDGMIWRFTGAPCAGNSCPGWQMLDNNPRTRTLALGSGLNPAINTVLAAHGNTDWHIDTANEFLFGTNMGGQQTAAHHAPDTWDKTHIHVGVNDSSNFYFDKSKASAGADTDTTSGIDRPMLFFYAGHGNPDGWSALGGWGTQGSVLLANAAGAGKMRYYWQCSCEVFAHGPETCNPATTFNYGCPDKFSGAADSAAMRNVFQRWGPALTGNLRMACGGSTEMYCHTDQVDRAWSDHASHYTVAQMFLDGFGQAGAYGVVPICMTLGGNDITKTPLYDTDFTNAPNTSGTSHYYLMYPSGTQQSSASSRSPSAIPERLQKFKPSAAPLPSALAGTLRSPGQAIEVTSTLLAGGRAKIEHVPSTGALHLDSAQLAAPGEKVLPETEYVRRAGSFLSEQGWEEKETAEPTVTRYMTVSMPVGGKAAEAREAQAGVTVQYRRLVAAGNAPVEVLGTAGIIRVQLNNEGAVLRASKLWSKLEPVGAAGAVKNLESAQAEAAKRLGAAASYKLDRWKIGYRQTPAKAGEEELAPVFQFAFVPVKAHDLDHPPQLIEVSALKD